MGRRRSRGRGKRKGFDRKIHLRTCEECRKYSRKTFYCAKWRKVFDQKRKACMYFSHRRRTRSRKR